MTLYVTESEASGNNKADIQVLLPAEITASLYQNAANPVTKTVSNAIPVPWNELNFGAINLGNNKNVAANKATGEITVPNDGTYILAINGSLGGTNPDIQTCIQVFVDEVAVDNVCDFPTTLANGKYTPFSASDIPLGSLLKDQVVSARVIVLEAQDEGLKFRSMSLKLTSNGK